ncbi:hypothetical protein HXY33_04520 [Candidatus Bathyarchaeota archaeon]|nr:hypothetical protein [Candidatus Bathyarchaeota archaeon]
MMWAYALEGKELQAIDVASLSEVHKFGSKADWLWVDFLIPDENESEILAELLGNEKAIVNDIKEGVYNLLYMYTRYEKRYDYTLLSLPFVDIEKELEMHPVFVIIKKKMIITWGCSHCPVLMKAIFRTLKEYASEGMKTDIFFVLSRLLREVVSLNSKTLVTIRERINKLEEEALHKSGKKMLHSIFELKKQVSTLHRLLSLEKGLLCDVREGIVPNVRLNEEAKLVVEDSINNVSQDLEFMDSYDRGLDSILSLLNLGSIHRVETSINFLTIILVIATIILVLLELIARSAHAALI